MNALVKVDNDFTKEDIELIKETVCKGANDTEFKLFLNQARKTGLNPLARQVFAVMRWDGQLKRNAMSIQVSIDGFRLIAERTEKYAGQVGPFWCGEDGVWKDVWVSSTPPAAAKVGALRSDFQEPCWGVARFDAYAQRNKEGVLNRMWANMGDVMIAKCAESLALRKAFPQELSGLYTSDEMAQASEPEKSPMAQWAEKPMPEIAEGNSELKKKATDLVRTIELCETMEELNNAKLKNAILMGSIADKLPEWHKRLLERIAEQTESLTAA